MLSIILIYVVPLLRKYLLPHIYKHVPFCNFSLYLKKAGLASRNIVHLNFNSTLYRSLLQSLQFIFVKPIRSTIDPTYTSRIIVHGCLLGHYYNFKLIFAQLLEHSRGVARIFPWGWPKYRFYNFCKCNLGQYPLPRDTSSRGGGEGGTFPNYLKGYVPSNRVVILERFRLL